MDCILRDYITIWTPKHLAEFPQKRTAMPECRDPDLDLNMLIFMETSRKCSFSILSVLKDVIFSLY